MGPMGNYMTLLQLARGRGGYGGPQGYGGYGGYGMARGPMGYGGPPQGMGGYGGIRPMPPQANDIQGTYQQQNDYAHRMAEQMAAAGQGGPSTVEAAPAMENTITGAPAGGPPGDVPPELAAARRWAGSGGSGVWNSGPVNAPSAFGASMLAAAQQGGPSTFTPTGPQENTIMGALQGYPGMNTAYNPAGLRGRRRFY